MDLPRVVRDQPPATLWSLCAGGYALLCSLAVLFPLGFVADVIVQLVPGPNVSALFAVPTPFFAPGRPLGCVARAGWAEHGFR